MPRKPRKPVQYDLFGAPVEDRPTAEPQIIPLDFRGQAVIRAIFLKDEAVFVLHDPARALDYPDASQASRLIDPKYITDPATLGISQSLQLRSDAKLVREPGLYQLLARTNSEKAKEFQDWLFEEVLPTIRRTGGYRLPVSSVEKIRKRLKCDSETAKVRHEQVQANKAKARELVEAGAGPRELALWHNSNHEGLFGEGVTAKVLRGSLGLKDHQTPLDRMALVPLAANLLSKSIAQKLIQTAPEPMSLVEQANLLKSTAQAVSKGTLDQLGSNFSFRIIEDCRRGKIIDAVLKASQLH